jgi:hypothetical protein
MKNVIQLDDQGYFVGLTQADESPLEPGVYLMPAGTIDVAVPTIPEGQCARWSQDQWLFEPLPEIIAAQAQIVQDEQIESLKSQITLLQDQVLALQSQMSRLELNQQNQNTETVV